MDSEILKVSTVLGFSSRLQFFYNLDNSRSGRVLLTRLGVLSFFLLFYVYLEAAFSLPPSEHVLLKRIWVVMSAMTMAVMGGASLVHFHALNSKKPDFYVLKDSVKLWTSKIGWSWITKTSVAVCAARSVMALTSLIYLLNTRGVYQLIITIYTTQIFTPWLELVIHLILAQFSALSQIVGVVLDEATESVKYRISDTRKHSLCVKLMSDLNGVYGRQIVLLFLSVNIQILQSSYFIGLSLVRLVYNTESMMSSAKLDFILHLFMFCNACVQLFMMVDACEKVNKKVDAFYKELFRLMRESQTLCNNKKLCLYVSMKKTVNFTACGFFNLGYPLITSIIAAATTYLVILVQFSIPKPE